MADKAVIDLVIGHGNAAVGAGNRLLAIAAGYIGMISSAVEKKYGLLPSAQIFINGIYKLRAENTSAARHVNDLRMWHLRLF